MEKSQSLTLRVEEAFFDDQGRALARICPSFLQDWGITIGDVIELQSCRAGARKVGVIVYPSKKNDRGVTIVRVDRFTRRNLCVTLGELVTIRRVTRQHAKRIVLAPAKDKIRLLVKPEVLKLRLLNHPIVQGEELVVRGKIRKIPPKQFQTHVPSFKQPGIVRIQVVTTDPHGIVVVGEDTEIHIQEKLPQLSQTKQQDLPSTLSLP